MKNIFITILFLSIIGCTDSPTSSYEPPVVEIMDEIPNVRHILTTPNKSSLLSIQEGMIAEKIDGAPPSITINTSTLLQEMDGFGFAITGGTAKHLSEMSNGARNELLQELFGKEEGQINISFIRISLGSSDLDEQVFSYNDLPAGATDINQDNFSIEPDQARLIPILKEILSINPELKILASPWSPPAWMKDNQSPKGGSLKPEYFESYAKYLTKYILAMQEQEIYISHLSIQNEPLHPGNNPSMYMSAADQAELIGSHIGPMFSENGLGTKIIIYDHNPDRIDYPLEVLANTEAKQYIDGSAFHLYAGNISALSTLKNQHPDKNIYFTEQWFGAPGNFTEDLKWHMREVVIGATRNWSKSVIEWNLSSNPQLDPHTDGGCDRCLGGITISGDNITRNAGYYVIGHIAKYVTTGSVRIHSNFLNELPNVAFITPDYKVVLIVLNNSESVQNFNVLQDSIQFSTQLDPGAVSTFIWTHE